MERAFEPFFTTKDFGKGSGLGLAQAYGFAQQAGGRAWLENNEGGGLAVHIDLTAAATGSMTADIRDSITVDRHIAEVRRLAGPVEYEAITDDQVVGPGGGSSSGGGRERRGYQERHRREVARGAPRHYIGWHRLSSRRILSAFGRTACGVSLMKSPDESRRHS